MVYRLYFIDHSTCPIKEGSFLPKLDSLNLDDNHFTNGGISFGAFDATKNVTVDLLSTNDAQ